jgi:hypothetical protein
MWQLVESGAIIIATAVEHGAVADRLNRGDFVSEKQASGISVYRSGIFQPAAKRQTVGRLPTNYATVYQGWLMRRIVEPHQ